MFPRMLSASRSISPSQREAARPRAPSASPRLPPRSRGGRAFLVGGAGRQTARRVAPSPRDPLSAGPQGLPRSRHPEADRLSLRQSTPKTLPLGPASYSACHTQSREVQISAPPHSRPRQRLAARRQTDRSFVHRPPREVRGRLTAERTLLRRPWRKPSLLGLPRPRP
jgi:hypothetical protein